jgi:carboxylesterase
MSKKPLGCLVLHGFTSHRNVVEAVVPRLQKHNIPYRLPDLRGHSTSPEKLIGVKWQDWVTDANIAMDDLLQEVDKVLIIALSMGSLVAMELGINRKEEIAGIVALCPALKTYLPVPEAVVPTLAKTVMRKIKVEPKAADYFDRETINRNRNYRWIPGEALVTFLEFNRRMRDPEMMKRISTPIFIIATTNDKVVDHRQAQYLYNNVSSKDKRLTWFHRTSHEILLDGEREAVLDEIEKYLLEHLYQQESEVRERGTGVRK